MRVNKTSKRKVISTERQLEALELKKKGLSHRKIGERLGISHSASHRLVRMALDALAANIGIEADGLRQIELERMDMAVAALVEQVEAGDVPSIRAWIRLSESRRKLLGLDAPEKISVNHDLDRHIEQGLEELRRAEQAALTGPHPAPNQELIDDQGSVVPAQSDGKAVDIPPVD